MTGLKKTIYTIGFIVIIAAAAAFIFRDEITKVFFEPTNSSIPEANTGFNASVLTVADNLETPWGMAFLKNGDVLVTERSGTLKRIAENSQSFPISGVTQTGEGGLLGIALHPDFNNNGFLYLYSTYRSGGALLNRVERYTYTNDALTLKSIIIDRIPGASTHDGGAIAFGPDNKLYITTGDAGNADAAQDTTSLSGKILRVNDDGTVPADNPFKNAVYSYGHRNPQGITWDDTQRLWSTEHGPSGPATGRDELNLIEAGANYGWPVITGDETRNNMRTPIAQSGDNETWAPGAIAHSNGTLYFTGLRGQALYAANISNSEDADSDVTLERYFSGTYGRLRGAAIHSENLYFTTSNTDGRGSPKEDDDKIFKVNVKGL